MRLMAVAVMLALAAGGCTKKEEAGVSSKRSLFREVAGAPVLRSGVWLRVDEGCDVEDYLPVSAWPECARSVLVGQGRMVDKGDTASRPYVFSGSRPQVMQVEYNFTDGTRYGFEVVVPLTSDDQGQVTALWRREIPCPFSEPPAEDAADKPPEDPCEAKSADKVLNLAQSVELGSTPNFRWIREGEN